jgi:hypothetical protein
MLQKMKRGAFGARPASNVVDVWYVSSAKGNHSQATEQGLIVAELIGSNTCHAAGITMRASALTRDQVVGPPSFPASDKRKDPRYKRFLQNFGIQCWEIDALDPNILRERVEQEIKALIEPEVWARCETVDRAQRNSLREFLISWAGCAGSECHE